MWNVMLVLAACLSAGEDAPSFEAPSPELAAWSNAVRNSKDVAQLIEPSLRDRFTTGDASFSEVIQSAANQLETRLQEGGYGKVARGTPRARAFEILRVHKDPEGSILSWIQRWRCPPRRLEAEACEQDAKRTLYGSSMVRTALDTAAAGDGAAVDRWVRGAASEWGAARRLAWTAAAEAEFWESMPDAERILIPADVLARWRQETTALDEDDDGFPDGPSDPDDGGSGPSADGPCGWESTSLFGDCGVGGAKGKPPTEVSLMDSLGGLGTTPSGGGGTSGDEMGETGDEGPDWELPDDCLSTSPVGPTETASTAPVGPPPVDPIEELQRALDRATEEAKVARAESDALGAVADKAFDEALDATSEWLVAERDFE
ncbi:MAG: hypothetical protein AAF602_00955, partial [Myxococcota bacterium]